MDGNYLDPQSLTEVVQHGSFVVTLCVLVMAGQALRALGRDSEDSLHVRKLSDKFLIVSAVWGAYFAIYTAYFSYIYRMTFMRDAGPIFAFMAMVGLASGLWLVFVGVEWAVVLFRKGGDASRRRARAKSQARVTMFLAAAWIMCCFIMFGQMYTYVYLSTLGLLLLGFHGAIDAARKLARGQKQEAHVVVRAVGALAVSLGLFAFIGVFYRAAFGESWPIVIRQLLVSISFAGVGLLLLGNRLRIVQLVLSLIAVSVVLWRIYDCVYKLPEFSRVMNRVIDAAKESGCGWYGHMPYHGRYPNRLELAKAYRDPPNAAPDCQSIPPFLQVTADGVIHKKETIGFEAIPTITSKPEFLKVLQSGVAQGLAVVVDKKATWKNVVALSQAAWKTGNHRILLLFSKYDRRLTGRLPEHRLRDEVENILPQGYLTSGDEVVYCAMILDRLDAFCPQVQSALLTRCCLCTMFEANVMLVEDLRWAVVGCLGDMDIQAMEVLARCFLAVEPFYLVDVPIAGPDSEWFQTVSLPADTTWDLAHEHILKATSLDREPIPPLRLLVGELSSDSKEE